MAGRDRRLGEILVERGALTDEQLGAALAEQAAAGRRLGEILVDRGLLDERGVRWALAEQLDLPLVHPDPAALDPDALQLVPRGLCRRYGVLPLYLSADEEGMEPVLVLAAADPARRDVLDDIRARVGRPVRVVAALREEIDAALDRRFGPETGGDVTIHGGMLDGPARDRVAEDPTGAELLARILQPLEEGGAAGVHLRVRDGRLEVIALDGREVFVGGEGWHPILLDRVRQLAGAARGTGAVERGRFALAPAGGRPSLFRYSILAGVGGEEAQIKRLLPEGEPRALPDLGLAPSQVLAVRAALERPGLVWVTAPAEQGLGSTLFGLLREVPGGTRTVTIEDEVFYRSPDLLQIETLNLGENGRRDLVRELKYLDFDRIVVDRVPHSQLGDLLLLALRKRWVLAASPEASMSEALEALAGRASDLPLYGLRLLVHQRLVPVLCPSCRVACALGTGEREALSRLLPETEGPVFQEGDGCAACGGRGVSGTRAFFEVLAVDSRVREALYGATWGEDRIRGLVAGIEPAIRSQVAGAVARGEVGLGELWDLL